MQGRVGRGVWRQPGSCLSVTCPLPQLTSLPPGMLLWWLWEPHLTFNIPELGPAMGCSMLLPAPPLCVSRSASSASRWSWLMITVRLRALVNELLCSGITHTLRTSSDKWASQPGQETSLSISESEPWPTALVSSLSIHVRIHTQLWRALREFK